jgi:hypothetical protein
LNVPSASKSLLSDHKIILDNNDFVEFHTFLFLSRIMTQGTSSLEVPEMVAYIPSYPFLRNLTSTLSPPSAFIIHMASSSRTFFLVHRLTSSSKNNIPYSLEINSYICDPCQQAKSHQLPYTTSTSVPSVLLEQVFSYVWGPAPAYVGKHQYYASFTDDYSTLLGSTCSKSVLMFIKFFFNFQQLVKCKFGYKIITMQTDWVLNMKNSMVSCKK